MLLNLFVNFMLHGLTYILVPLGYHIFPLLTVINESYFLQVNKYAPTNIIIYFSTFVYIWWHRFVGTSAKLSLFLNFQMRQPSLDDNEFRFWIIVIVSFVLGHGRLRQLYDARGRKTVLLILKGLNGIWLEN